MVKLIHLTWFGRDVVRRCRPTRIFWQFLL